MKKLKKYFQWLDKNLIKILLFGFVAIIPLYPKFPLKFINYTYIAVRVEDLYVGILFLAFIIQLVRKKITLNTKFMWLFIAFWAAITVSFIIGVYANTLPYHQVAFLNIARRFEYMFVFFVLTSTIRSKAEFFALLKFIVFIFFVVCVYGVGQKFLGWPAVQTMNPEYAKGYLLFLTPDARISSSFSGHYDLAAYLVFLMPMVLGLFFARKNYLYLGIFILSVFTLVLTAARSSFIAYLISIIVFLLLIRKPKYLVLILLITGVFTFLNKSLSSRIARTFQVKQIFVNDKTGQVIVPQRISTKEVPAGSFYVQIKSSGGPTTDETNLAFEKIHAQIRDQYAKEGKELTATEEARLVATMSAGLKSINTVVSDISFATRLQVEWPRAINALLKNPLFGTGAASITEATDNDFLRWLGEFGLVGTGFFLAILYSITHFIYTQTKKLKSVGDKYIYYGFLFGLFALLINAGYIDVFEASKVAYHVWLMTGLLVSSLLKSDV